MYKRFLRFLFCVVGIYYCYLKLGIVNEGIYKTNHGTKENPSPQFSYGCAVILLQMILLWGLSQIVMIVRKQQMVCTFREGLNLGSLNFLSMYGALTALQYVSFPLQAITKSCKIISVLFVGLLIGKTTFTKQQIICGIIITSGIFLFNISESSHSKKESSILGICLLVLSLFCDGLLASLQTEYKSTKHIDQWEMQIHIARTGAVAAFLIGINDFTSFQKYLIDYPQVLPSILEISVLGVVGQLFIFYCIKVFSPRVLSIVTTSRKFFTILFSIFINGHHITHFQWIAISLVAIGLSWELKMGMKHKHPHPHTQLPKENKPSSEEISYQKVIGKEI